ncbi:MAG: RdgB/HAM1 family non-canonical purine NTP pyrophosphatase [Candidatus Solibacter usitatus]|nr:RdgB/HAM1 family non-canonical purine NTP pyrophosphatase [Candidatus Solibacter usitatus]
MILRCASTNAGKIREFRLAATQSGFPEIDIQPLDNLNSLEPCIEDGGSFEANAVKKALYYSVLSEAPVFADDSGLVVDALEGAPGVRSARYSAEGTDQANNRLLIDNLRGREERAARFSCVIALARQGVLLGTFHGAVEGLIVDDPRGEGGFGYDPHFYYPPCGATFGELDDNSKLTVSHRGQALRALLAFAASTARSR